MYAKVKSVVPLSDYRLLLTFDNSERRVFDVKPYLRVETGSQLVLAEESAVWKRGLARRTGQTTRTRAYDAFRRSAKGIRLGILAASPF